MHATRAHEPRRIRTLLAVLVAFACGQVIAFATDAQKLWPLSPVNVYTRFPSDWRGNQRNVVVVTPEGEIDAVRFGDAEFRMIRKPYQQLKRAKTKQQEQAALAALHSYLVSKGPPGLRVEGVRVYSLEWDLTEGRIVGSELEHELRTP